MTPPVFGLEDRGLIALIRKAPGAHFEWDWVVGKVLDVSPPGTVTLEGTAESLAKLTGEPGDGRRLALGETLVISHNDIGPSTKWRP